MRSFFRTAAFLALGVLVRAEVLNGGEPLRMKVSPIVAREPAILTVRVSVEAAADNRILRVTAESADFYTSSEVSLDGRNSRPLTVFEFRNLPKGLYEVTGVLVGAQGQRATVSSFAQVDASTGWTR